MSSMKSGSVRIRSGFVSAVCIGVGACSSSLDSPDGASSSVDPLAGFGDGSGAGFGDAIGSSGGFDPNAACAGQTAGAEISPTVLQLVVDTSGSMDEDAPGPVPGSKWEATRRAVLAAADQMRAATAVGVAQDFASALADALGQIARLALSCSYDVR
jgi:hypothetical protein